MELVETLTVEVVTVKFALVVFAVTVTLAGTVAAAVLLLESMTTAPLAGARPLSVNVAWDVLPPITLAGLKVTPLANGGEEVMITLAEADFVVSACDTAVTLTVDGLGTTDGAV